MPLGALCGAWTASSVAPVSSGYERSLRPCHAPPIAPRRRSVIPKGALSRCQPRQPLGQLGHPPPTREGGRLCPRWVLVLEGREWGRGVQRGNSPVEPEILRLLRKPPGRQRVLQGAVRP